MGHYSDYAGAQHYFKQALETAWACKDLRNVHEILISFAELRNMQGHARQAARLLSLAHAHAARSQVEAKRMQDLMVRLQALLSPEELVKALEHGKTMKLAEVVEDVSPRTGAGFSRL